jgi:hypothetical protein
MADFSLIGRGGIGHGETLPLEGRWHGEIFELVKDTLSKPQFYTWNSITKKWDIWSGSSGDVSSYTNSEPTISALGGIEVGSTFEDKTMQEMFDMLLYPYMSPSISLSTNPSGIVREYGNNISSIVLSASITKKSDDIVKIEYYKNGSLIHTNGSPSSGSSTDSYTDSTGINNNTTYMAKVYDDKSSSTSSVTHTYVYPMYIGNVSNLNSTETDIKTMTKLIKIKGNQSNSYTISSSRFCFAYPSSYGNLTSILDPNGFEMLSSFTKTTSNFTMLDGLSIGYNIYTLNTPTTQSAFTVTYKF